MNRDHSGLSLQAAALKRDFNRSFAEARQPPSAQRVDLLAIRLAGDPWAIPLSDISALHSGKKVTPVPSRVSALLGIAGFRGELVPVYDLASLIGLTASAAPRWLALAVERRIALAFADLDGHLRIEPGDILPQAPESTAWTRGFIRAGGSIRPILHLSALLGGLSRGKESAKEGWNR
jgi:purine-binding chemotaxis protein CheW